ncbi:serine hydrolase domain-containing protein [Deefgea rivuli]|uniref:serine hydrolase domain-containing protein n=1 Tax=Deefgea rivuli TaxID=400948 RepID=UPI00048867BB|nr:serine hydrolase [Deefgea rivuli]
MRFKICSLILLLASGLIYASTNDLPTSSPEAQGIDSAQLNTLLKDIQASGTPIDSILIMRNGYIVLDSYFYPYQPNTLHDLRSVTKSVTSTMLGISIQQGKLKGLDQPMRPFFAEQLKGDIDPRKGDIDPRKAAITLGNLVDMHSGIAWYEWPYTSQSSAYQMMESRDWNQFVLKQKMDDEPGRTFNYNGGNMNLLSEVIQQAWSKPMQDVAQQQLFKPLGITQFTWGKSPQGQTVGESALMLKPHDVARLGQFWLQDGVWEGQRLLPAGWTANLIAEAKAAQTYSYRRGFWLNLGKQYFQAAGRHGQFIRVDPAQQLVIVTTGRIPDQNVDETRLNQLHQLAKNTQPLPENTAAHSELAATVHTLGSPPQTSNTLELGKDWYGKTWRFTAKPWGIEAINIKPDPQDAGALIWEVDWAKGKNSWPVGIDGAYRSKPDPSANNLKLQARARWLNSNTLELKTLYNEASTYWKYTFNFSENSVDLKYTDDEYNSGQATGLLIKP